MPHETHRRGQPIRGSDTALSRRRVAADLSIRELAEKAGLPRSVVGLIDQGRAIPKPHELEAIEGALGPDPTPAT